MQIKSIKKLKSLQDKIVFLRVDFNVPLIQGKIQEDYKIKAGLQTIEFLLTRGAKIVIASHLGEPKRRLAGYSLKLLVPRLRSLLKRPVKFLSASIGSKTEKVINNMKSGDIVLLENLRFYSGEYNNDLQFAANLAKLADIYVNDAFAVCHRAQASLDAIKQFLPSYAGILLEQELQAMDKILKPKKPLVIIMGGAKLKTKLPLILKLYPLADWILIGGALANNFFKFQGLEVGRSLVDNEGLLVIKQLFKKNKIFSKIILPRDITIRTKQGRVRVLKPGELKTSDCILDIGPLTIKDFAVRIKTAETLVWNGPLGRFEEKSFKHGTIAIATLIASRSSGRAYGLVGGGETVEALKLTKMTEYIDWVSTGGGAMLTYLGGGSMPGLNKIITNN